MHSLDALPFQRRTVSFVRRDNRLDSRLQRAWDHHHEMLVIDVPRAQGLMSVAPGFVLDQMRDFGRVAPLVVEIGSGTGDAIVHGARARPDTNFLGVEVYRRGLAATMAKIAHQGLTNVRLVQADGVQVLEHMVRPASVAEMWVFFADPWHKLRHHKRRLVNAAFAELAASRLSKGGLLRLATDWADYATQMRDVLADCQSLTNSYAATAPAAGSKDCSAQAIGFSERYEGRAMTLFERKGLALGRTIYDLELRRA
jgi:tRNA (guanine-N7-)-methyltransferase